MIRRRRDLLALAAAALAAWSSPRSASLPRKRVGVLSLYHAEGSWEPRWRRRFLALMVERGFADGKRAAYEWRYAERDAARLPAMAAQLVATRPDALLAFGSIATRAAARATASIPIVCGCLDAIKEGYTASLSRPTANVTGYSEGAGDRAVKLLEFVKALAPRIKSVTIVAPQDNLVVREYARYFEEAATQVRLRAVSRTVRASAELAAIVHAVAREGNGCVVTLGVADGWDDLARLTLDAGVPVVDGAWHGDFVAAGGLLSYGPIMDDFDSRVARQLEKLLRGERLDRIPFEQPTRFTLKINRATARALGLEVPADLLLRADEIRG